jgi:aspartate/methionine/tyrosine aminotransferase
MDPLAAELNETILAASPALHDMLSDLGRQLYFPKGILTQSAESKVKATRFNATIGIATEKGVPMHFKCAAKYFNGLTPREIFDYAPSYGLPALRERWLTKIRHDTPSLGSQAVSLPVVTHALTHGLAMLADLFVNPGDLVLLPDKFWGNYKLIFSVRKKAEFVQFPFFDGRRMNLDGFRKALQEAAARRSKIILLLNFPNNPTGYSISTAEAAELNRTIAAVAAGGTRIIVIADDAYYGLFYDAETLKESIFGGLAGLHENVLAVKADGATKEHFVWGFRVGFLTFGIRNGTPEMYEALVKKLGGAIRGNISNCSMPAQSLVLKFLDDPELPREQAEKFGILAARALKVREVLANPRYADAWEPYPFNSGYFMCLRLKQAEAEKVRVHLLDKYQTGTIATGKTDLRIAFSSLEIDSIPELFVIIYKAAKEVG